MIKQRTNNVFVSKRLKYIVTILLVIFSAYATDFSRSPYGQLVGVILLFIFFIKLGFQISNSLIKISFVFFTFIFLQSLITSSFHPLFIFRIYISVLFAYFSLIILGKELFFYLERVVYVLALISLPLFILQLINFDLLFTINRLPENIFPFIKLGGEDYSSSIIFTMKPITAPFRNSGFAWEPGAFAAFLAIPIAYNFIYNKFKINKRLIVMSVALLTTTSTMGYLLFFIFIFLYYVNQPERIHVFVFLPFLTIAAYFILTLPFVGGEILAELERVDYTVSTSFYSTKAEFFSLGRMGSFLLDLQDFLNHPIVGVGGNSELLSSSIYTRLQRTNGLSDYLVTFGAIGFIALIFNLSKTFSVAIKSLKMHGGFIFVIIILVITFSNSILVTPLLISFQLYYLLVRKN